MNSNKIVDADTVIIRGYSIKLNLTTFLRLMLFIGSFSAVCFLWINSSNKVFLGLVAFLIVMLAFIFHASTKIEFSKGILKVKYGVLPIVRKRNLSDLRRVHIESSRSFSDEAGGTFEYLVLDFNKAKNIKIIVDPLSRK
ncbi:hypothetical protein [uncultured Winogradskyella sp.]|uniref:hypothetical protein n=1 Tax=uncultured Winogradskyella sp. TaxID=395353 RepID=UPI00261DD4B8|nr:hypothetical protein [uncultured Winogradskyella sp.]